MGYFRNIGRGIRTSFKGMSLTMRHLWAARKNRKANDIQDSDYFDHTSGRVTVQFPHESILVPENGRYQLDCEIDDCIVCDKCAKVCPVDCIEIDAIKSSEIINYASDGSPIRLYAAKFDIDMAKCCFCGLCTTVCPTECLTMSSEYDFSVRDVHALNFAFSNLTPEQAEEKRNLYEQFVAEKNAAKTTKSSEIVAEKASEPKKTAFRPSFKPVASPEKPIEETPVNEISEAPKPKPTFKPKFQSAAKVESKPTESIEKVEEKVVPTVKPSNGFKPKFKVNPEKNDTIPAEVEQVIPEPASEVSEKPKGGFKPKFKINTQPTDTEKNTDSEITQPEEVLTEETKPKAASFRPKFKLPNKD